MKIFVLCIFIAFAKGQADFPCCGPDETWEANEGFMVGTNKGGVGYLTEGFALLSYDNAKQMVNKDSVSKTAGKTTKLRILQHFKEKVQYTIDANGNCTKSPIAYPFIPSCVPVGSKKVSSTYYGTPDNPYSVDVYQSQLLGLNAYITVNPISPKVCAPVAEVLYGQIGDVGQMMNIGFSNYTKGIKDPTVFVVPPQCKQAPLVQEPIKTTGRLRRSLYY